MVLIASVIKVVVVVIIVVEHDINGTNSYSNNSSS